MTPDPAIAATTGAAALPHAALTIAGFDPGSGAGVTADLLTFARCGVFATSAITALTVQSTRGVRRVRPVEATLLRDTLQELDADLPPDGIKIGMLATGEHVSVVAAYLRALRKRRAVHVVLDPIVVSSSGAALLDAEGLARLQAELLPLVDSVTPNLREAALLTGLPCETRAEAEHCAEALRTRYPNLIPVITGGHWATPCDLVLTPQGGCTWLCGDHVPSKATHGTGCVFSTALLASRLRGSTWLESAAAAKAFVSQAIRTATPRGSGFGPTNLIGNG